MIRMETSRKQDCPRDMDKAQPHPQPCGARRTASMKILQLGKFYPILGGVEKVMYDLTTGLSERGIRCDMLCAASEGGASTLPLNGRAELICCSTWKKVAATMIAPSMIAELKERCREYDIIHVHHPDPMACLALFLSGYRGKVVLHWHSDIQKQKLLLGLYRPLQDWLLRRADVILGTTPVYLDGSPCLRHVQHKTRCLPIGVDPVCPGKEDAKRIQERYAGKKIVYSLGRLVAYKGYRHLVEAARYLDDSYVVLIGGAGEMRAELEAGIRRWGLEGKVELLGRVSDEDLPAYYGACRVFCLPSVQKTEAFGIVQIEAMSCGKPVVATNIPQSGVAWVNAHGYSGLNVTPGNGRELAEAIMRIAGDEEVYREYAGRAERRYRELFTREKMIENLLEIYNELWKGRK